MKATDSKDGQGDASLTRLVSLPWLKSTEGYTVEVETADGHAVWATAIAPTRPHKAPRFLDCGKWRAEFHRMERRCIIYRQANEKVS
jgi:hypothetical protein